MSQPSNPYEGFDEDDLILRDELAIDRTILANERTFLAYVRTALAFAIVGGTCLQFAEGDAHRVGGIVCFVVAAAIFGAGGLRAVGTHRRISIVRTKQRAEACRQAEQERARRS